MLRLLVNKASCDSRLKETSHLSLSLRKKGGVAKKTMIMQSNGLETLDGQCHDEANHL